VKEKKIPDLRRHDLWLVDSDREGCNATVLKTVQQHKSRRNKA